MGEGMAIEITTVTAYFSLVMLIAGFLSGYVVKDSILEDEREDKQRIIEAYNRLYLERLKEMSDGPVQNDSDED
jgi:hypothetical protein